MRNKFLAWWQSGFIAYRVPFAKRNQMISQLIGPLHSVSAPLRILHIVFAAL
ncbi:hypothetical protein HMPREF0494_0549 [Limosilactobacillus antri DSM 16041]|uniref:Uncharacterized protein n=1 Tax=Limosilactobacillus antri DSM 16041 TaxID=525309 RepID=C8P5F5_9LACO|nr:hypothetical protein HMPREF0494_0549 [Limosilactobacillus antri DSM 16041]KRK58318.1 hypothetical protein FC31_GL000971 [Limosilactobacillus antri DSM 16041]